MKAFNLYLLSIGIAGVIAVTAGKINSIIEDGNESRQAATASRLRAFEPWRIANDMRLHEGYRGQPLCFQYAINLAYRLNTETDARAIIVGISFMSYEDYSFNAHAMVIFFAQGRVYVADQNLEPTELDMNKVDWKEGNAGVIDAAFHQHLSKFESSKTDALMDYHILDGKSDVEKYFGPKAADYFKALGNLTYIPFPYSLD